MRAVGLSQLKEHLGEYVRQAQRGHEVLITDRGAVVAMLARPVASLPDVRPENALAELADSQELRRGTANSPNLYPRQKPAASPDLAQELLAAERGEP